MKREKPDRYTDDERLSILRDYFESGSTRGAIARKYHLKTPTLINSWIKRFSIEELNLSSECKYNQVMKRKESLDPKQVDLEARVRELEKALAYSKLETLALNTLIDIAEKQGIPIRKKSGAKQ